MQYNVLKRSGLKVSEVSFGCMSLKSESADNDILISRAIEAGINLFDTADLYEKGANETLLGKALKGRRHEVLISTKVGNRWKPDGSGWDWDPSKKHILTAVDDSLRRLQTDHINLYLLHGGTTEDPIDEAIEAFERLVDSGKIRSYGLSSIRPNVIREYVNRSNISAVMTQYSLLDRRPEEETLKLLLDNEIEVLARGGLASGLLVDKPVKDYLGLTKEQVTNILTGFANALPEGRSKSETALRYVVDNEAVTTAVVGIRTLEQLEDVLASANASCLTDSQLAALRQVWPGNKYQEHR
ncbi:aldo/keto reductase [Flavobacterium zepuense]|uniref:Aldo/keto reductase n=1 Tax=Flavobacterium zepuense TaxID=2593302 RepID=A0A552V5L9_9FLAO|nr:aldo/keto reductase [Flavobacterium zepuense]TRW25770.1 aldo/keto reductase [Flavobacterium zepuense]